MHRSVVEESISPYMGSADCSTRQAPTLEGREKASSGTIAGAGMGSLQHTRCPVTGLVWRGIAAQAVHGTHLRRRAGAKTVWPAADADDDNLWSNAELTLPCVQGRSSWCAALASDQLPWRSTGDDGSERSATGGAVLSATDAGTAALTPSGMGSKAGDSDGESADKTGGRVLA